MDNGYVDYGQWDDNARFDALVEQIAAADVSEMTREEKLVFYINAYNILAARGILDLQRRGARVAGCSTPAWPHCCR